MDCQILSGFQNLSDPTSQEPRPGPLQLVLVENLHISEDLPMRKSKLNKLRPKNVLTPSTSENYDQELTNPIRTVLPALAPAVLPVFSLADQFPPQLQETGPRQSPGLICSLSFTETDQFSQVLSPRFQQRHSGRPPGPHLPWPSQLKSGAGSFVNEVLFWGCPSGSAVKTLSFQMQETRV